MSDQHPVHADDDLHQRWINAGVRLQGQALHMARMAIAGYLPIPVDVERFKTLEAAEQAAWDAYMAPTSAELAVEGYADGAE